MPDYLNQRALPIEKTLKHFRSVNTLAELAGIYYGQRKYDGCQGIVNTTDRTMVSRTGKAVLSCDHIIEEVRKIYGAGHVVFGEVWMPRTDFATSSGKFRRHNLEPDLWFVVYDMVNVNEFANGYSPTSYRQRYWEVVRGLERANPLRVSLAAIYNPGTYGDPQVAANALVMMKQDGGDHYDGLILRNPDAPWELGDATDGALIKVKPHLSFTLRVVGFDMAVGAKTGRPTAALLCAFKGGKVLRVGSGLDHASQADPGPLVGKLVEVEATEYSSDGLLREPRFKGVRSDVVTADF
jgi:ATP-dependent DNA ligase